MENTAEPISSLVKDRGEEILKNPHDFSSQNKLNGGLHSNKNVGAKQKDNLSNQIRWLSDLDFQEDDIEWIWEGFLAKKHITLFSAAPKTGKTTLLLHLLLSQDIRNSFLNHELKPTKVLILSEESSGLWLSRREEFGINGNKIAILPRILKSRLTYQDWKNWITQIRDICLENNIETVVFDTLASFWPVIDENSATSVTDAYKPFYELTENNLAILLIHHERKNGGSYGVASRGSTALTASADIILSLKRASRKKGLESTRILNGVSRFDETPNELVIKLVDRNYEVIEGIEELQFEQNFDLVLNHIPASPSTTTIPEIISKIQKTNKDLTSNTLWRWMKKAHKKGLVLPKGKLGNATLWSKTMS